MVWRLLALAEQLDEGLLRQVFTHSSWVAERGRSYERLEFLGDSVLSLAVTTELYRRFPEHSEGSLARLRAYVVSRATCAKVGHADWGCPPSCAASGRPRAGRARAARRQREHPRRHDRVAHRGRLLTYGLDVVRPAVIEAFTEHISFAERSYVDFKTELQEQLAKSRPLGRLPAGRDDRSAARARVRPRGGGRRSGARARRGREQEARRAGRRRRGSARAAQRRRPEAPAGASAGPPQARARRGGRRLASSTTPGVPGDERRGRYREAAAGDRLLTAGVVRATIRPRLRGRRVACTGPRRRPTPASGGRRRRRARGGPASISFRIDGGV